VTLNVYISAAIFFYSMFKRIKSSSKLLNITIKSINKNDEKRIDSLILAYEIVNHRVLICTKKGESYGRGSETPTTKNKITIAVPSSVQVTPSSQVAVATIVIFPSPRMRPVNIFAVPPGARLDMFPVV